MTEADDRVTVSERYRVAVANGGDMNMILAAALQKHRTGALLLRLLSEYDYVRGELERAGQIKARSVGATRVMLHQAALLQKQAKAEAALFHDAEADELDAKAARLIEEAQKIREQRTPAEIMSARAFILLELKSLPMVKQDVGSWAISLSKRPPRKVHSESALQLAGRVLDVFLDPVCEKCDGTGVIGNKYAGQQEVKCSGPGGCNGSGQRPYHFGHNVHHKQFSELLLGELDRQVKNAARAMAKALRSDAEAGETGINAALRERLRELGSVEAAAD